MSDPEGQQRLARGGGCVKPDAVELRQTLAEVELAMVTATEMEAEPLHCALAEQQALEVVGRPWWLGRMGGERRPVRVVVLVGGYDKANTAHALTLLLASCCPELVMQVGVAGAFTTAGLDVGDLVLPTEEVYGDTGVLTPEGWRSTEEFGLPLGHVAGRDYYNVFPLDRGMAEAAARVVAGLDWSPPRPRVVTGRCLTLSQVTGVTSEGERLAARWGALAESMEGAAAAHMCALFGVPFLEVRSISNLVADRDTSRWDLRGAVARAGKAAIGVGDRLDEVLVARCGARGVTPPDDDPAAGG
jgi:futalosine hydrolase